MANGDCTIGVEVRTDIKGIKEKLAELHNTDELHWAAIEKVRETVLQAYNRAPAWCVWGLTAMGTALGAAVGALITVLVS